MNENVGIVDKINKLLAKAKSSTFENEASVFMQKAEELMQEYQLSISDLNYADPIDEETWKTVRNGPDIYKKNVFVWTAAFYGCKPLNQKVSKTETTIYIVGPESARVTTNLMFPYIWKQVTKAATNMAKTSRKSRAVCIREISNALIIRMSKMVQENREMQATGEKNAIVPMSAVDAWIKEKYKNLRTSKKARTIRVSQDGVDVANNISLFRQTGDGSKTKMIA